MYRNASVFAQVVVAVDCWWGAVADCVFVSFQRSRGYKVLKFTRLTRQFAGASAGGAFEFGVEPA